MTIRSFAFVLSLMLLITVIGCDDPTIVKSCSHWESRKDPTIDVMLTTLEEKDPIFS